MLITNAYPPSGMEGSSPRFRLATGAVAIAARTFRSVTGLLILVIAAGQEQCDAVPATTESSVSRPTEKVIHVSITDADRAGMTFERLGTTLNLQSKNVHVGSVTDSV